MDRAWTEDADLRSKVERIARGAPPRVLDLFSGCGGISLGFHAAGFRIDAAVEMDPAAAMSHALNFHGHLGGGAFAAHAAARDITATDPGRLAAELGLGPVASAIDVLVGGPPCQAYARVGRAKLRQVAERPDAFRVDPRRDICLRYLEHVRASRPLALLMEDVPDILNQGGHNVLEDVVEALADMGYAARHSLINSAFHGVPQMRDRVFLVAARRELGAAIRFPAARWWKMRADFPVRTLLAHLGKDGYSHIHHDGGQARCVSVREAARLQSFPDGFRFRGTMNPAFRQIGNSVPPLLAKAMASCIGQSLREAAARLSPTPTPAAP